MMKKIIPVILTLALSLTMCLSGYAEEVTAEVTTNDKVEYLVSQGIPKDLLAAAPAGDIDDMYAAFYGKSVEYLGTDTVTMQETSPITTYGTIPSANLAFGISRLAVRSGGQPAQSKDPIDFLYVYAVYEWQKGPVIRWKDGITVNWDPSIFAFQQNSFIGPDGNQPAEMSQGGIGFYADLTKSTYGSAKFKLVPTNHPMYVAGISESFPKNTSINGNYLHNKNPIGFSVSFSIHAVQVTADVGGLSDSVAEGITISYK